MKWKNRSVRAADSNHEPLDPKSFNFQLSHMGNWTISRVVKEPNYFSANIVGARGAQGQGGKRPILTTPLLSEDV